MQRYYYCSLVRKRINIFVQLTAIVLLWMEVMPGVRSCDAEDRLMAKVAGINLLTRPVRQHSDSLQVKMGVAVKQVIEVNELSEKLTVSMWRRIYWTDYRLTWNETEYEGVSSVRIPPSNIWIPDIILNNRVEKDCELTEGLQRVKVSSSGECFYSPFSVYTSQCSMDIKWFPLDHQFCRLDFVSWSYPSDLLNLTTRIDHADLTFYTSSTEWSLVESPAVRRDIPYECCKSPFSHVTYTLHLKRRVLYYVFNLIIPCALISFITCLAFLLPIDSGERTGLCITTLLSLTVYQIIVLEKIPASSESVPIIGVYFMTLISMNGAAVLMTILSINLHRRTSDFYTMPNWVRRYICGHLARLLRVNNGKWKSRSRKCSGINDPADMEKTGSPSKQNEYEQTLNPLFEIPQPNSSRSLQHVDRSRPTDSSSQDQNLQHSLNDFELNGLQLSGELLSDRSALLKLLETIISRLTPVEQYERANDEWKFAALVIDRAYFWLFLTMLILGSLFIFLSAPSNVDAPPFH